MNQPSTGVERATVWWAVLGVVAILGQALARLVPRAIEPLVDGSLGPAGVAAYVGCILGLAYFEGYRGFQLKFSPRVVVRAQALARRGGWLVIVAPLMAMGLIHASRRRLIASWCLAAGIVGLVLLVRLLDQPWRGAVDAGVVVGLGWGAIATLVLTVRALRGKPPDADPDLPARG